MAWHFNRSKTITKRIETQYTHPSGTAYGDEYNYDQTPPEDSGTFTADALTDSEVDDLETAANTRWSEEGSTVSLDVQGVTWSGKTRRLRVAQIMGVAGYSRVEVVLHRPVISP